jgi:hypothetical protein
LIHTFAICFAKMLAGYPSPYLAPTPPTDLHPPI